MRIRRATPADFDGYLRVQGEAWGDMAVDETTARERFQNCPEGILVAEERGEIIGTTTMIRLASYDFDSPPSWNETTDFGRCSTHDPAGRISFGVDLSGTYRAADPLLLGCMRIVLAQRIRIALLGGRMPSFARYQRKHPAVTANEYVHLKRKNGHYRDPEIHMYSKIPGLRPVKAIPGYFDDPESLDNGVLLRWQNPLASIPIAGLLASPLPLHAWRIEQMVKNRHRSA